MVPAGWGRLLRPWLLLLERRVDVRGLNTGSGLIMCWRRTVLRLLLRRRRELRRRRWERRVRWVGCRSIALVWRYV